jgi:hypothetical protein
MLKDLDGIIGMDSGLQSIDMEEKNFKWNDVLYSFSISKSTKPLDNGESKLKELLKDHESIFRKDEEYSTISNLPPIDLKLVDKATPIKIKPFPMTEADVKTIEDEIGTMLKAGIVTPIENPAWGFPMFVTSSNPPRYRKRRTVIDFRKLNNLLESVDFDAPSAEVLIDTLPEGSKYFTSLDLAKGYLQVKLSKESSNIVVVSTKSGFYRFNVMPLGLKPAVAEFQKRI